MSTLTTHLVFLVLGQSYSEHKNETKVLTGTKREKTGRAAEDSKVSMVDLC